MVQNYVEQENKLSDKEKYDKIESGLKKCLHNNKG